jgi:hypothetical protein
MGEDSMPTNHKNKRSARERLDLDRRYGEIGISAVAAALRFRSETKKPASAPVAWQPKGEAEDVAA